MAAFLEGPLGRRKTPLDSRKMRRQTTIERGGLLLWPLYGPRKLHYPTMEDV